MQTLIIFIALILAILIFIPLLLSILRAKLEIYQSERFYYNDISEEEYKKELLSPDFESFETYFHVKLPISLKYLYLNQIDNINIIDTDITITTDKGESLFVALFYPMSDKYFEAHWEDLKNMFTIATDGQGNEYFVNPKEKILKLYFFEHETKEIEAVANNLETLRKK